jgi:phospholipid/cholesterol/gamma-HCH transport system substrate-binding protein
MEIRANYILVGLFALLMLFGGLGFTLWMSNRGNNVPLSRYDISFNESVLGLSVNSDVLFNGLRVGKVEDIAISDMALGAVRVRIAIASNTPVREDSRAQIAIMGLTGVSAITISGGTARSPLIKIAEDAVGKIEYAPSPLSSVMTQMPDMLASIDRILHRMENMFSDHNTRSFSTLLDSLTAVSTVLASRTKEIDRLIVSTDHLVHEADKTFTADITSISKALSRMIARADSTLSAMEPGLRQFSGRGLADIRMLALEMRNLIQVLTRVSRQLENDPRRFLFGESVKEYDNK